MSVTRGLQALILAGGKGTRLRPYTTVIPKPLMPVGDQPVLEILLRQMARAGVDEVIVAAGVLGQLLQAFFQDGSRLGLRISYAFEDRPLGTAGPIGLLADRLHENFFLCNGDLLTTLDFAGLMAAHLASGADATIATYTREVKIDFGVVEHRDGALSRYIEKPTYTFDVSMGINVLRAEAVRPYVLAQQYLDVPDLAMRMKADGRSVRCHRAPCYWLDIGRLEDYQAANEMFAQRRSEFLPDGT